MDSDSLKKKAYLYPNDEQELDRLDMQYHLLKTIHGGRIFFSPIDDPARILDIGTGSGIWPIEMGMENPLMMREVFSSENVFFFSFSDLAWILTTFLL